MKRSAPAALSTPGHPQVPSAIASDNEFEEFGPRRSKRVRKIASDLANTAHPRISSPVIAEYSQSQKYTPKGTGPSPQPLLVKVVPPQTAPPRWRDTYDLITLMRSREIADVDTMGCQLAQEGETDLVVSCCIRRDT
jgi:hypothetical protein